MVILFGLAAAVLYGCGDFIGGMASRRVPVLTVLMLAESAGSVVALAAAVLWSGPAGAVGWADLGGLAWGVGAGLAGGLGLILFYTGLATGPMSVVAPVSGLVSTILPVAVALAEGELAPGSLLSTRARCCAWWRSCWPVRRAGTTGPGRQVERAARAVWRIPAGRLRTASGRAGCSACSSC